MIKIGSSKDVSSALTVYPGLGYPNTDGSWRFQLSGIAWQSPVVISMRQRMMIRVLGGVMHASPDDLSGETFQSRIKPFMAEAEHRQRIVVKIGEQSYRLGKRTKRNGRFDQTLTVPDSQIQPLVKEVDGNRLVEFSVSIEGSTQEPISAVAYLYLPGKVSVVSDIDDTIKDSAVGDRRELLATRFFESFAASMEWPRFIGNGLIRVPVSIMFPQAPGSFFSRYKACKPIMVFLSALCT